MQASRHIEQIGTEYLEAERYNEYVVLYAVNKYIVLIVGESPGTQVIRFAPGDILNTADIN